MLDQIYIYIYIYIVVKILHTLCRICKMLIILPKQEGNACNCLFSTDLNKIFHIKYVYILSTRENNSWIYKNDPVQKVCTWFLILCCYLNDPQLCFVLLCDSCSTQEWRGVRVPYRVPQQPLPSQRQGGRGAPVFLSVFVLRGLQSAHPPSPMELLRLGTSLPGGGSYVRVLLCVSCVPASCVQIWFVSCPRLMSLWVNPCPAVFV